MSQLYRAAAPDGLILHPLDSMTLIFQRASGITHIVSDPVPAIMESMETIAITVEEIAERLSATYHLEEGIDTADIVRARLEELCSLGLVERV